MKFSSIVQGKIFVKEAINEFSCKNKTIFKQKNPLQGRKWDKKEKIIEYKNLYNSCLWRSFKKGDQIYSFILIINDISRLLKLL
jgi:hypothetical protein